MIGSFRDRVEISEIIQASDGAGGFDTSTNLLYTLWGSLELQESETTQLGSRMVRADKYKFLTRRDPLLTNGPARINKLQYVDKATGRQLSPKKWKVDGAFVEIELHYIHES